MTYLKYNRNFPKKQLKKIISLIKQRQPLLNWQQRSNKLRQFVNKDKIFWRRWGKKLQIIKKIGWILLLTISNQSIIFLRWDAKNSKDDFLFYNTIYNYILYGICFQKLEKNFDRSSFKRHLINNSIIENKEI